MSEKRGLLKKFLTPRQRDEKFRDELNMGVKFTNDGKHKVNRETGIAIGLTPEEKAWRSGYIQRGRDNAKLYAYHNKNKK